MDKNTLFTGQPILGQLLELIPRSLVNKLASQYRSDRYYKKFKTYDHLVTMLYASLGRCTSLREVTTGLLACCHRIRHLGLVFPARRSTLSDANRSRPPAFFESLFHELYKLHFLSSPDSRKKNGYWDRLFMMDSTTIDLFSAVMKGTGAIPANGKRKGGAKAHVIMKASEDLPCFVRITESRRNDKLLLHDVRLPKGSILVFDKGYENFGKWDEWSQNELFWVTRSAKNTVFEVKEDRPISAQEITCGVRKDQMVILGRGSNPSSKRISARRIEYYDTATDKFFVFVTNLTHFGPSTIARIYQHRWQIECLFKRLKQHYPLRSFLGDNENAIRIQIWAALITDLLVKVAMKMTTRRKWAYANLASFLRLHLMTYISLRKFLDNPEKALISKTSNRLPRPPTLF